MISGHRLKDSIGKDRLLSFPARLPKVIAMEGWKREGWKTGRGEDGRGKTGRMEEGTDGRMVFPDQLDMTIAD